MEYGTLGFVSQTFLWEDDGVTFPHSPNIQDSKAFYERELAHPRPIYTENQIEYLRERLKWIDDRIKRDGGNSIEICSNIIYARNRHVLPTNPLSVGAKIPDNKGNKGTSVSGATRGA